MSASGTKWTLEARHRLSALGLKADLGAVDITENFGGTTVGDTGVTKMQLALHLGTMQTAHWRIYTSV
jgi:hypothetical protein